MRLRRSDPSGPGYGRRRHGRGTVFLDPAGEPIRDPARLARLRGLVISVTLLAAGIAYIVALRSVAWFGQWLGVTIPRDAEPILVVLLLGVVTAFYEQDGFTELAYFTSEADARRGERREMTDDAKAMISEWERVMSVDRYLDITDPWLTTAR